MLPILKWLSTENGTSESPREPSHGAAILIIWYLQRSFVYLVTNAVMKMRTGYPAKVFGIFQIRNNVPNVPNEARYYSKYPDMCWRTKKKKQHECIGADSYPRDQSLYHFYREISELRVSVNLVIDLSGEA